MSSEKHFETIPVWDPLVRIGHWLLVAAFFTAYFTEDESLDLHVLAGYLVGAIVVVRILWGFAGPQRARFTDFAYGPARAIAYLRDLARGSAQRYIGHSPAGGLMVMLLLASLVATTWSGLMVYAYEEKAGPLAPWVLGASVESNVPSVTVIGRAMADEDHDKGEQGHDEAFEDREEFWEETHEFFADLTMFLVLLHIGGVLLSSFAHRENLVAAMITGRKRR